MWNSSDCTDGLYGRTALGEFPLSWGWGRVQAGTPCAGGWGRPGLLGAVPAPRHGRDVAEEQREREMLVFNFVGGMQEIRYRASSPEK